MDTEENIFKVKPLKIVETVNRGEEKSNKEVKKLSSLTLINSRNRNAIQRICEGRPPFLNEQNKDLYKVIWNSKVKYPAKRILKLAVIIQLYMDQFFDQEDKLTISAKELRKKAQEEFSGIEDFCDGYLAACRYGSQEELKKYSQCEVTRNCKRS